MNTALIKTIYKINRDGFDITTNPGELYADGKELVHAYEKIRVVTTFPTEDSVFAMATSTPLMWPSMFETNRDESYQAYRQHPRIAQSKQAVLPTPGNTETYLCAKDNIVPISAETIVRSFMFTTYGINTKTYSNIDFTYGGIDDVPVTIVEVDDYEGKSTLMVAYTPIVRYLDNEIESYLYKTLNPVRVSPFELTEDFKHAGVIKQFI